MRNFFLPLLGGIIALFIVRVVFDGSDAEGFFAYLIGNIHAYLFTKEDVN